MFSIRHRRKHTTCEAGDCAVHTYSVTAASSFMGKLQPFSYEARTDVQNNEHCQHGKQYGQVVLQLLSQFSN